VLKHSQPKEGDPRLHIPVSRSPEGFEPSTLPTQPGNLGELGHLAVCPLDHRGVSRINVGTVYGIQSLRGNGKYVGEESMGSGYQCLVLAPRTSGNHTSNSENLGLSPQLPKSLVVWFATTVNPSTVFLCVALSSFCLVADDIFHSSLCT
jgi:hypothetical protein